MDVQGTLTTRPELHILVGARIELDTVPFVCEPVAVGVALLFLIHAGHLLERWLAVVEPRETIFLLPSRAVSYQLDKVL